MRDIQSNSFYQKMREVVSQARGQAHRAINTAMVQAYWHLGRLIIEEEQQGENRAIYGTQQLQTLSKRLTAEFGKGFDVTNLRNMRRFYEAFPIRETVSLELSWSHYNLLSRIENQQARNWYTQESITENWSVRALERQIGTLYYERLISSQEKQPVKAEAQEKTASLALNPKDFLRDPYILDFLNLESGSYQENDLEQGIINKLQNFLLEMGKGFAFVERQQRLRTDDGDYYIDLVFYNYLLKCFVLVDLKLNKLTHQDVGQMDMYVRMYEEQKRRPDDNPTIGLILCSENNHTVAQYSVLKDNQQLFASEYLTILPSEEELQEQLKYQRQKIEYQIKEREAVYQL